MDWKRTLGSSILSVGLILGTFTPGLAVDRAQSVGGKGPVKAAYSSGSPFDLGVANDDRLIEMLKKSGQIAKEASPAEADKALQAYLHQKALAAQKVKTNQTFAQEQKALKESIKGNLDQGLKSGKGNKLGQADTVKGVQNEAWNGQTRKDEVLVLLIDYPDLPHGKITKEETDMYYSDPKNYSQQHYQDMIFGKDGYVGPDGKTKISMKQFYDEQSGGSYTVEGQVAGWYTAKYPAAHYGGSTDTSNDVNPRALIREALANAAKDSTVDLTKYDQEDPYDLDGDGNTREPDGIIDHLMVIHSGVGEEAGGGSIGSDAIWSHSWDLGNLYAIPNTHTDVPYWGGALTGLNYTVEPEDGAAGVFSHEFGHNLGLPDEYDTLYSGSGEPVSYWSIMSSGSWTGAIPGTEPSGFSPYDKEYLQASMTTPSFTPNWQTGTNVNFNDLTSQGTKLLLDQASSKGTNNDVVKVTLPDKKNTLNTPKTGSYEFWGGKGDEIDHSMVKSIDLTNTKQATLDFDTWYNTEKNWDFAMVQVSADNGATWKSLSTDQTTSEITPDGYPSIKDNLPGYTGNSNGWIHQTIDLNAYAGKNILLQFRYMTDWGTNLDGFMVDNVKVTADGNTVVDDGAEGTPSFDLTNGFQKYDGSFLTKQYYLLEWRTQNGSDSGLASVNRKGTMLSYDSGLLVWYVDDAYDNNWTGPDFHPGNGFLGVVDADQHNNVWHDKVGSICGTNKCLGSNSYQMHDAAFSLTKGSDVTIGDKSFYLKDNFTQRNTLFDDSQNYLNPGDPDVGRNVPHLGLNIRVVGQSNDGTVGEILLSR